MSVYPWNNEKSNEENLIEFLKCLIQTIENHNPSMERILNELQTGLKNAKNKD